MGYGEGVSGGAIQRGSFGWWMSVRPSVRPSVLLTVLRYRPGGRGRHPSRIINRGKLLSGIVV
jgi:hypothetical protein